MIDKITGDLLISTPAIHLGCKLSKTKFLSLDLVEGNKPAISNAPFITFKTRDLEISGILFVVSIQFYEEILEAMSLCHTNPALGLSWNGWTEEKERRRKEIHDECLRAWIGITSQKFAWGDVSSNLDLRTGESCIGIRYSWKGQPWPSNEKDSI